jgi:DNA helicase-2/ATP-dependent DNA helicase PcrA
VDEYQDTNHAQYRFLQLLAGGEDGHRNLAVVGDPDQSVYSFRGADIRNILEFQDEFEDARIIRLEQNYRSTQTVLDTANALIGPQPRPLEKHLWTDLGRAIP